MCTLCYVKYSIFALYSALSFYMYESSREKNKKTLKFLKNKKKTHFVNNNKYHHELLLFAEKRRSSCDDAEHNNDEY